MDEDHLALSEPTDDGGSASDRWIKGAANKKNVTTRLLLHLSVSLHVHGAELHTAALSFAFYNDLQIHTRTEAHRDTSGVHG